MRYQTVPSRPQLTPATGLSVVPTMFGYNTHRSMLSMYRFLYAVEALQQLQQRNYQMKTIGNMTRRAYHEEKQATVDTVQRV